MDACTNIGALQITSTRIYVPICLYGHHNFQMYQRNILKSLSWLYYLYTCNVEKIDIINFVCWEAL